MGINSKYGVSAPAPTPAAQRYVAHAFFFDGGLIIEEGDPETLMISGDIPSATPGNTFLIKVMIFGDSPNTVVTPNLVFRLAVDGVTVATDNLSAPTIDTETWTRGFSEEAPATTGLVEVFWEYSSATAGADMNASRITLLIEEVSA